MFPKFGFSLRHFTQWRARRWRKKADLTISDFRSWFTLKEKKKSQKRFLHWESDGLMCPLRHTRRHQVLLTPLPRRHDLIGSCSFCVSVSVCVCVCVYERFKGSFYNSSSDWKEFSGELLRMQQLQPWTLSDLSYIAVIPTPYLSVCQFIHRSEQNLVCGLMLMRVMWGTPGELCQDKSDRQTNILIHKSTKSTKEVFVFLHLSVCLARSSVSFFLFFFFKFSSSEKLLDSDCCHHFLQQD